MFEFKSEPDMHLLTVTRTGLWSLATVRSYETALRTKLAEHKILGKPTLFIVDIRSSGAQARDVADALRTMVKRLGPLNADRTAVVTASGIAKLQASQIADVSARVFTSMVLARDWVLGDGEPKEARRTVHDVPSDVDADGAAVHVHGPSGVDILLTPSAALKTAKCIGDVAATVERDIAAVLAAKSGCPAYPAPTIVTS